MHKKSIAIISNSVAGYILAAHLERSGKNVVLVDTGDCRKEQLSHKNIELPFLPAETLVRTAFDGINELLAETITLTERELSPLTVENGKVKPFVGFGDSKSVAIPILSKYNMTSRFEVSADVQQKISTLAGSLNIKIHNYAELKKIELSCERVEKIIIDGDNAVHADDFIFLNSPKELLRLLPESALGARARSRIAKSPCWAKVAFELKHPTPFFDGQNLFFLTPNQAEQNPCVGQFIQSAGASTTCYSSIWETYINSDQSEDPEYISAILRNMRKLINRAFIGIDEKLPEVIAVTPYSVADYSWIYEQRTALQPADNIIISPALAAPYSGMLQSILAAQSALDQFRAYELREALPRVRSNTLI
ncbi:MAG: hypothetical protein A2Z20_02020 [Bdellovibrionales bacterium RBG_16_40_8]|nr:MAG: hypothetical protein A2Z20_02020 [Bdellovibrionales bacterium RBG_16_40_8]